MDAEGSILSSKQIIQRDASRLLPKDVTAPFWGSESASPPLSFSIREIRFSRPRLTASGGRACLVALPRGPDGWRVASANV